MNANLRNFALWVIIVVLLLALFTLFQTPGQRTTSQDISFSQLLNEVDAGRVRDVVIQEELPHVPLRPAQERVHLHELELRVPLNDARDLAVVGPLRGRFQNITIGRVGVQGRGSVHELPGAVLINAATSTEFAQAWGKRVRR